MDTDNTITSLVAAGLAVDRPIFAFRPQSVRQAARFFLDQFRAKSLYAVKANPDREVLALLHEEGIRSFDVASLQEVALIRELFPEAELYFMHPVKSRHAIREAYFTYGVRHFSLDSEAELQKILTATDHAKDLALHVRLAIPNNYAELALAEKFGISLQDAPGLIRLVRKHAERMGICFHVGSQCMHPDAYRIAMRMAGEVTLQSGVTLDYFNVGGGFPSIYPGMTPPPLQGYFDAVHDEFARFAPDGHLELLAEPGRALVAESMSLIVRVELRRGNMLHINDGTYGSLFDAGTPRFIFPVKLLCDEKIYSTDLAAFGFYGPTCDSLDYMKGPFYLPSDTEEGDYIEIGQLGAYGRTMATPFNGFLPRKELYTITGGPLMTLYGSEPGHIAEPLEVIAA